MQNTLVQMKAIFLFSLTLFLIAQTPARAAPEEDLLSIDDYEGFQALVETQASPAPLKKGESVLLFLNLNLNPKEAAALKRVAQKTGQTLVSFPDDQLLADLTPAHLSYAKSSAKTDEVAKEIDILQVKVDAAILPEQKKALGTRLQAKLDEIEHENYEVQQGIRNRAYSLALQHYQVDPSKDSDLEHQASAAYKTELTKLLTDLELRKVKVKTVVISGHHGQYFFGDLTVAFNESDENETEVFDLYAKLKPLTAQVNSIALWGCESINENAAQDWLKLAPYFQTLLGYSDSAPAGSRANSAAFLEYGLLSRTHLLSARNREELKGRLLAIPGAIETASAVVVRSRRLGDVMISSFIFDNRGKVELSRKTEDLSKSLRCSLVQDDIHSTMNTLTPYFTGESPLPPDETLSPIKRAYFFLHHNEACYVPHDDDLYSVFEVGLLRFFDSDVKFNIAKALKIRFAAAEKEIEMAAAPAAAFSVPNELRSVKFGELFNQLRRPALIQALRQVHELSKNLILPKTRSLMAALKVLVLDVNSKCMPFDQWHERSDRVLAFGCPL
ncbi:MAG: hypothetical protein H7333_00925 [Bdellovibrionales bacterium]|nr:hypothetical protein [Oligoflexia bacterium]